MTAEAVRLLAFPYLLALCSAFAGIGVSPIFHPRFWQEFIVNMIID
jgi:hypothetical protein